MTVHTSVFKYVSVGTRLNTDSKLSLALINAVVTPIGDFGLLDFVSYSHHFLNSIYIIPFNYRPCNPFRDIIYLQYQCGEKGGYHALSKLWKRYVKNEQ